MTARRPFDLVIFDLDGTLADTGADIAAAMRRVLEVRGLPCPTPAVVVHSVGWGADVLVRKVLPPEHRHLGAEVLAAFRADYRDRIAEQTRLYPGSRALLGDLRAAGARLALATNKPRELTLRLVDALALDGVLDHVLGPEDVERHKPAPDALLEVMRRAAVPPARAVMVGDMETDIDAGAAAGVTTVLLTFSDFYRPDGLERRADHVAGSVAALRRLLLP